MSPKKRAWLPDEFAPPQLIKPLRAPRMGPMPLKLPDGGQELLDAMDKLRKLMEQNANDGSIEIALGELRGTISYVRSSWKYSSTNMERHHKSARNRLIDKYGDNFGQLELVRRGREL